MNEYEIKVDSKDVILGMYVSRLDRSWLETPFLLQGFLINDQEDKRLLIQHCSYCYVDIERSKTKEVDLKRYINSTAKKLTSAKKLQVPDNMSLKREHNYKDSVKMADELKDVRITHTTMSGAITDMMQSLKFSKKLDLSATREALKPMVDSILRNPDALLWLNRLRQLDDYNYSHSLGCSIWAMALGRQLGLSKEDIEFLGLGGLLFDVGKTKLSSKILEKKEPLNPKEVEILKSHVKHSLDIVNSEKEINYKVMNMIESHHERIDGSGYPNGIKGNQIPLFGKIAAIIDCYDAITSDRSYSKPLSSQEAVKKLYEWRGTDFQAELVEEFIQAIGMFPAGSLVELSTGEVAVVVAESRTRRLRPKVMLLLNADKSPREDYVICNLLDKTHDDDGNRLDIIHALPAGSYNIKPDDYFL